MSQPEPQKNKNTTIIIVIVLIAGCALCIPIGAAILFPVFAQARIAAKRTLSMNNAKQITTALLMYAEDNDQRFPLKDHWCDDISKYLKDSDVWRAPEGDGNATDRYDYAMIAARAGQPMPPFLETAKTPLMLESGSGEKNQSGHYELLPQPSRYKRSADNEGLIGYTDGHVKFETYKSLGVER